MVRAKRVEQAYVSLLTSDFKHEQRMVVEQFVWDSMMMRRQDRERNEHQTNEKELSRQ